MVQIMQLPDFFGAQERGIAAGRADKEYRRTEANREEIEALAPQIMAGDTAATTRGMVIDKERADDYQDEHTRRLKQLRAAAKYMKTKLEGGDDLAIQAAWSSGVRPFLAEIIKDKPIPEAWSNEMRGAMEQALAMTAFIDEDPKDPKNRVQSRYTDSEGNVIALMGDGSRKMTGDKAAPNIKILEQEGQLPTGYVTSGGKAGEAVPLGGAAPTNAAPPAATGVQAGTGDAATVVNIEGIDPGRQEKMARTAAAMAASGFSQEEIDAFMAAQMSMPQQVGAPAPAGNSLQTSQVVTGGPARTPTSAEKKAAETAATGTMQTLSPDEVAAAGLPEGTFAQKNTLTGEIKVGPAAAQNAPGAMTAAQREKLRQQAAKAKTAVKGTGDELDRMKAAVLQLKKNAEGLQRITGVMSLLPNIPGGAAANAQADLDALKSQIGFAVLQKMRQNSPTGGALGNVSDKEGARLEQNLASLDNAQSYEQMVQRLDQIIQYVDQSKELLQTAYDEQFSDVETDAAPPPAAGKRRLKWNTATQELE